MDYAGYLEAYFQDPQPAPRFEFTGGFAVTLYFADYKRAVAFYTAVLGPPGYEEGSGTRGWAIDSGWLTLLQGGDGRPTNVEVGLAMSTPADAEALQEAFIAAGGQGGTPSDQLMYWPVRVCPVTDPFGTDLLIFSRLPGEPGGDSEPNH
jgi:catechol 2,3-dioxygenase-like lactoylglutathione lyase family enzyme